MLVFNHYTVHLKAYLVLFLLIGLSAAVNAQSPAPKGNTRVIDKSKLAIHQNYRDEQPQRFDNSRSRIVALSGKPHAHAKVHAPKNAVQAKNTKGAHIKHSTRVRAVHHKINRKIRKTH